MAQSSLSTDIREKLFSCIDSIFKNRATYLMNPKADFTRHKTISFQDAMLFPITMDGSDVFNEMHNYFPEERHPSESAMIQQRNKIKPEAFKALFELFRDCLPCDNLYKGKYRIVAGDGSRLNLPYNPLDEDTFCKNIENRKGINQVHLNTLHDVTGNYILDVVIQDINSMNEKAAFLQMIRRFDFSQPTILLADRGYPSFNLYSNLIHSDRMFLFRVKSSDFMSLLEDDAAFNDSKPVDRIVTLAITRSRAKEERELEHYHYIRNSSEYDALPLGEKHKVDFLTVRLLKFPLSTGADEYIVTNLPQNEFDVDDIKELYHLRWGIETAYRDLKYSCSLVRLHSIKESLRTQEIYAKMILFNFASYLQKLVGLPEQDPDNKYTYVINFRHTIKESMRYLQDRIKDIVKAIRMKKTASRPGRSFPRERSCQSAVPLTNR